MLEEKVDEFIGRRFGKDEHLEVVGWNGERQGSGKLYTVRCSKCVQDAELFTGMFLSKKFSLISGKIPCGCSKNYRYSEGQYAVRVHRLAQSVGYEFIGFSGVWCANLTKIKLRCLKHGCVWDTTNINCFLTYAGGCPDCKAESIAESKIRPDSYFIDLFMSSGNLPVGAEFYRSDRENSKGDKVYWTYTCPTCSNDEYVDAGVCSGEFEATAGDLARGHLTCRCSKSFRWTQSQREYQINKIILSEGLNYDFLGFVGEYENTRTEINLRCREHSRVFTPTVNSFVNRGNRCPSCSKSGYDPSKIGYLYVLLAEGMTGEFTGYGITGNPLKRVSQHRKNLSDAGFRMADCRVFTGDGKEVLDTENLIKDNFICVPQGVKGFRTESTRYELFERLCEFVTNKLKEVNEVFNINDPRIHV